MKNTEFKLPQDVIKIGQIGREISRRSEEMNGWHKCSAMFKDEGYVWGMKKSNDETTVEVTAEQLKTDDVDSIVNRIIQKLNDRPELDYDNMTAGYIRKNILKSDDTERRQIFDVIIKKIHHTALSGEELCKIDMNELVEGEEVMPRQLSDIQAVVRKLERMGYQINWQYKVYREGIIMDPMTVAWF